MGEKGKAKPTCGRCRKIHTFKCPHVQEQFPVCSQYEEVEKVEEFHALTAHRYDKRRDVQ